MGFASIFEIVYNNSVCVCVCVCEREREREREGLHVFLLFRLERLKDPTPTIIYYWT